MPAAFLKGSAQYEKHRRSHQFRRSCFAAEAALTRRAKNDGHRVCKPIHVDGRHAWPMLAGTHWETRIAAASLRDTHESAGTVDYRCHFGRACRWACANFIPPGKLTQMSAAESIAAGFQMVQMRSLLIWPRRRVGHWQKSKRCRPRRFPSSKGLRKRLAGSLERSSLRGNNWEERAHAGSSRETCVQPCPALRAGATFTTSLLALTQSGP
jgi:hypothetical protein